MVCFTTINVFSQTPCTSPPMGPGCRCYTAEVLCTPDAIDGFTFTMSSATNYGGFGFNGDLCPGNSQDGVPNNVNWFGFIAWCTDLTINVNVSDCVDPPGPPTSYGVQIGLFETCGSPWDPIECFTNGGDYCGDSPSNYPTQHVFIANDLTIGNTYYFMLDGCGGSYCTVELDVVGTCGTGTIDPWTTPIQGPLNTCVGQTNTYTAEDLDGATDFYWYLDGAPLATGTELTSINYAFNTVGTYQLCVDVSNDPCIPVGNLPAQTCITVNVFDANAGTIMATPNPACPEQDITWSVTGYLDDPDYEQHFFITNDAGIILEIFPDDNGVLNFDECGTYTLYSYNFAPPGAFPAPVVGSNVNSINCNTGCCDLKMLNIVIQDTQDPVFVNPPGNLNLTCFAMIPTMEDLAYTDNCIADGTVAGVETGMIDDCDGGTLTRTWTVTDLCDNTTTHVQTITMPAVPQVVFLNPPANMTIQCEDIPNIMNENLNYTNNGSGGCLIQGSEAPVVTGMADNCGGEIIKTWSYTGVCGNPITHVQTITVEAMDEADFVNPPQDVTLDCGQFQSYTPQNLSYTNGGAGNCLIQGIATPTFTNNIGICGGSFLVKYEFMDACSRPSEYEYTVTVLAAPEAMLQNVPTDITIQCDEIASVTGTLDYTNNVVGACNISGTLQGILNGSPNICGGSYNFKWSGVDVCNRLIEHNQQITVEPMPVSTFQNPPADITVQCDAIPTAGIQLQALNNGGMGCNVDTLIDAVQTGSADICGGTITYTWTFTDQCQNTITEDQRITVLPMPSPMFVNPPGNITAACENMPLSAADLQVINNGPAGCNINTNVPAVLEGTPTACGGSYNFKWTYDGQCQDIEHIQTITITPPPQGTFQNPPANITVNCDNTPQLSDFPTLTITNNLTGVCTVNASVIPNVTGLPQNYCGGVITATWTHTDQCQNTVTNTQTVTVNPAPQATFSNVPPDITVACIDLDNNPISLTASNNGNGNCLITGTVNNNRTGTINYCGGTLTDTWNFVDLCGRSTPASRSITVLPAPKAIFTNLPADITVACADAAITGNPLPYSNGLSGICEISGAADFIPVGTYNACGGQLFGTWTFTDQCNHPISYIQNITVLPAEDPQFIDPPMDTDLGCGGENLPSDFILVSNGGIGNCAIDIDASLTNISEDDGVFTNTWQFTHPCTNVVFTHTQTTSTIPQPNLFTEDPEIEICAGQTFDLSTIVVTDLNNTDPVYTFHSTIPGDASNEVLPEVMPNDGDVYFIQGTNSYGCPDAVAIYFIFADDPMAGGNGSANVCNDGSTLNLNSLLNGNFDNGGSWVQINGSNLNLSNPAAVNFLNIGAGNYFINYIVESSSSNCPSDTANFTINVTNKVALNIATLDCVAGAVYEIKLTSNATTVTSDYGTVQKLTLDTFRIFNIPQGQGISITGSSANGVCSATITIAAPNCACPFIAVPSGQDYYAQCENISNPITLSVTVPAGMQANWYNQAVGGTAFLSNSLTYSHTNINPGTYSYFVETFDPLTLCVSLTRLEIVVEILTLPQVNTYTYNLCDAGNDGVELFDLNTIHSNITSLNNSLSFHLNNNDAINGTNGITSPYSNTTNPQTLHTRVVSTSNCINTSTIILNLNASPNPVIDITDESCFGSDDGSISVSNHNSTEGWEYSFDNVSFSSNDNYADLEVNNYVLFTRNINGCKTNTPFAVAAGMIVNITTLDFTCSNNGTLSDPNDDVYTITINAQNSLGINGNYVVTANGNQYGTFPYNVNSTFNLPANGATIEINVSDASRNCSAKRTIGPLISCSTDCIASLNIISNECNNNGTPTNPADDYYIISFNATAQNGSSTNDYLIYVGTTLKGKYNYGQNSSFTTPANGNVNSIRIQDSEDLQCNASVDIGPLSSCSDECLIDAEIVSINCFNPGETPDPADDYYEVVINAQLINGGVSNDYEVTLPNGTKLSGIYGQDLTITLPANNSSPTLSITDNNRPDCSGEIVLTSLTPCSEPCVMNVQVTNIICDNAGTNDAEDDDTYTFEILVTGNNNTFIIEELNFNGVVGTKVTMGPYKITEGLPNLTVYYESNPNCKKFVTIQIPEACSSCDQTVDAGNGGEISCTTPEITLTATSSDNGIFNWELNGGIITTGLSIKVGQAGTYYIIAEYPDGCMATDSVLVTIDAGLPVVTVSRGHFLSCDITEVTIEASATGNNLEFEWTNEVGTVIGTGLNIKVTQPGKYYFRAYNTLTGCSSSKVLSEVTLDIEDPSSVIYARPSSLIDCVIKTITLYTDGEEDVIYTWRSSTSDLFSTSKEIEIDRPGNYFLTAVDTINGCDSESNLNITEFIEYPLIYLEVNDTLTCLNESVLIDITGSQTGPDITYKWKDEEKNIISSDQAGITVTEPGIYYLELSDADNGCINEDTVNVEIFENEINVNLPVSIDIEEGTVYQLNAQVNIPINEIKSIRWSPAEKLSCSDCLTPNLLVNEDGVYSITVEDIYGCIGMAVIRINSIKLEVISIPNVISTSSGSNGGFTLYGNDQVTNINYLKIFDRWGNLMFFRKNFAPNDPSLGWNGKVSGKNVEQGVYVYVFEIELVQSGTQIYKGDITVIR